MFASKALQLSSRNRSLVRSVAAIALLGGFALLSDGAAANPASPFAKFVGSWDGAGQVAGVNGSVETLRCRATYATPADAQLSQSLTCASDSYRIQIHSFVVAEGRSVEGHWEEATRQVTGHLAGTIADGRFEGSVSGTAFTAGLSLNAAGSKQTVVITPNGGDIARVNIVLSRHD